MSYSIDIYSFFSGIGFLDLGFETSGYQVVFANELSEPFSEGYLYSREQMNMSLPTHGVNIKSAADYLLNTNDIAFLTEKIVYSRLQNNLVAFIAGPPCPDFSAGGKNRGRKGDKGRLTENYVELIEFYSPDIFLFENVKGLWRTKKHRAFYEEMKKRVIASGYVLTDKLINAIEYGTPQDRDRIILFGFKNQLIDRLGYSDHVNMGHLEDGFFPWSSFTHYKRENVFSLDWPDVDEYEENVSRKMPSNVPIELTVEYWFEKNNVEKHFNQQHHFMPRAGLARFQTVAEGDMSKKSYKRLHRWRYSPTVAYGNNEVHVHPYKPRRLSVAEALSIQSLPKDFELPASMTLSAMFKGIGNGVPFLAARGLAKSIQYFLRREINGCQTIEHE